MKLADEEKFIISVKELSEKYQWHLGNANLRLFFHKPTGMWRGVVSKPKSNDALFEDALREQIVSEMETGITKGPPPIVGQEGARNRFLFIYPGGFSNSAFAVGERGGKIDAGKLLKPLLDESLAVKDGIELLRTARKLLERSRQSPLHMTESADLEVIWRSQGGATYVRGIQAWASGDRAEGFSAIHRACEVGRASWPMFTLFPALLNPTADAILRPKAVNAFARATKSTFCQIYETRPSTTVYSEYLHLLDETSDALSDLDPRDYVDLASFVWVSTSYGADEKPRS